MRFLPLSSSLAFAALIALPCSAQYTVKRLVFKGAEPYKQAQLEAVAGLKTGQHFGTKEMGEAAQRLMDTGVFADIETTVNGPMSGIDVIFKLKTASAGGFLPASFENLAWLTPEEREAGLQRDVPLYTGRIPAASSLQAAVQVALTQMLAAKGLQATVETTEEPSPETRPTPLIAYRITSPKVMLSTVHLEGVSPELAPAEKTVITRLTGSRFNEGIDTPLERTLLQPYLDAGYIDAKLDGLTRTPGTPDAEVAEVMVSARVLGGDAFRIASITWAGSELFSVDDFAKVNKLHPGDIASDKLLRASYKPLLDAYLAKGYVDVSVNTQPKEDTAAHTVAYSLAISPGNVYKVGSLTVIGLTPELRARFDSLWKLPVGAIYDGVYAFAFLPKTVAADLTLARFGTAIVTTANPDTRLVDIVFTFAPRR
jgi:outer membrane protein assembly factor BamA